MTPPDDLLASVLRMSEGLAVLYAEDEPEVRAEMTEMLQSLFPVVVSVENGALALEAFRAQSFALVITDINMPLLSGIELIRAIRETTPQQSILVTSAYSDSGNLVPLINLGVGSFVLKPLVWKQFLSLIHRELASILSLRQEVKYQQRLEKEVRIRTDELREIQQTVVRLQEAKDNMLALISHELRTPLNGILGFIELIRTSTLTDEAAVFLSHVEDSAKRLERSTRKALDFASLSTGKRTLNVSTHEIAALLSAAREQLVGRLEGLDQANIVFQGDAGAGLLTDGEMVIEILKNLLENSVKYGGGAPRIEITSSREGVWDQLTVRDHGPGFPDAMLQTLFQPFSTGNIMHHAEGMGLGLALVDVIMLTLGGRVEAANHPEGGALVKLRFLGPRGN